MFSALCMLGTMLCSLRLSAGSFPKPLSKEEEAFYLQKSMEGDLNARNILVEHNLRLVAHILKKYYAARDDLEDLQSVGTIGLMKAVSTYRPDKSSRLSTYAARCIENAMRSLGKKWKLFCKWEPGQISKAAWKKHFQ